VVVPRVWKGGAGSELELSPVRSAQSQSTEPQDTLPVSKQHLNAFAIAARLLEGVGLGERPGHVKLDDVPDRLPENGRVIPFAPRHVCHFVQSKHLDLLGKVLARTLISSAHPSSYQLLKFGDVRPARPGVGRDSTQLTARPSRRNSIYSKCARFMHPRHHHRQALL